MSNQRSLDMLFDNAGKWLLSRCLVAFGDPAATGPIRSYVFGSQFWDNPDPGAANRAVRKGWRQTDGHEKGRAARVLAPTLGMGATLLEGVTENVGHYPMLSAADVNLSGAAFFTPIGGFGTSRFAVTGQLTGCCFVWDKANARVAHIRPASGISGNWLRTGLGSRGFTVFGSRGETGGTGEYDIGEDVTVIGTNNGGWRFFAQVHVRNTTRIQRVVEL